MKAQKKKNGLFRRILNRYRCIPRQLHSPKVSERSNAQKLIALTICLPVLIYCGGYLGWYKLNQSRIRRENAQYSMLYATPAPTEYITPEPTTAPTVQATAEPMATPTAEPTIEPTALPTPEPTVASTVDPLLSFEIAADATLSPYATPDADTMIYALETPLPVQPAFEGLLVMNPETIGYLTVGSDISLPVVQRRNDNDFYLNHNFEGETSDGGTLFLDGSNLLTPEDRCLIVYGHNMRNGTMFHSLNQYEDFNYLTRNSLVYFDTLYKNRCYVPFAVFTASMDEDSRSYIDIRQFDFDADSFDLFVLRMQRLSQWDIPIDVVYGDDILLLVTCEYTHDNGRFVVALRAVRGDESEQEMRDRVREARAN